MPPEKDGESLTTEQEGETPNATDEQDDALWNEVASERDSPAGKAAEDEPDPVESETVDAKPGSDEDSGENKEAADAKSDPPASEASSDDIWATASPELKAAREAEQKLWEQRFNSVKGRLSVQDRLLDALRSGSPGSDQGGGKKAKAILASDEFKTLKEEYGGESGNLSSLISAVEAMAERQDVIDGAVDQADQARGEVHVDEQLGEYARQHPDWASYGTDERWGPWLAQQPQAVREAAERNQQYIVNAADASLVMRLFKADHGIGITPKDEPQPSADDTDKGRRGDERRDRQRAGGRASVATGGPASTTADPEDDDQLWNSIAAKKDRQIQKR